MTPRRLRTFALAIVCAMSPALAPAQDAESLRLRVEKQLRMAPTRPERDSAKFLEADRIVGEQDRNIVATGNVTLRQRGATIRADRVEYAVEPQTAVATGGVKLERHGDTATGPRLDYNLAEDTGEMLSPVFEFPRTGERKVASRGQAERALLEPDNKSRLFRAEYTSCPAPRDDWFIRVNELEVDTALNVGKAYNTTVFFLGLPILYSPYLSFPLDNKRRTGFLAPTLGTSGRSGFEIALPYYWNIAENRDATLTPKLYSKRGLQLGGEFRYLEPRFAGQLEAEFLPRDRIADRDRYFVGVRHGQQLWGGWSLGVNAQKVSDDDYFRDLSTKIAATSQTNLPRDAILAYEDDSWAFSARALAYQTLQDPNPEAPRVPIPYRILPRLTALGLKQNVLGFDWQFLGEYSNFRHPQLVNGQRAIVYPSVMLPWRRSWGYVAPKFGYHFTRYVMGENAEAFSDASRSIPISSVDAGLFFDRDIVWRGRGFQHTLEPRVYYLNVPYRDQSRLPNFTTAESDFNFAQLFTENRFVGGDRIGDANQLTVAVTTRLIESSTGLERFRAALGQVQYFRPPRVTLGDAPRDSKSSDIVAIASSQLAPAVSIETGFQYTPNLSRSQKLTLAAHYSPVPGSVINAAYRYARGSIDATDPARAGIEQVDLSTQWPITRNLSGLARWNWSTRDRKLLEGLVGFEYNAGCWQVRAVAHRFITATQQYSTSFQIQLELSGLSRIGINPLETIRQNITGYRRSDEIAP
ncbi:MAG TPA: LPS-assembly protein LptD [Usitatibacter sp.]|nr:LPS-assembly protein LptD [Usitatibacter sp.]